MLSYCLDEWRYFRALPRGQWQASPRYPNYSSPTGICLHSQAPLYSGQSQNTPTHNYRMLEYVVKYLISNKYNFPWILLITLEL